ncbi:glucan 1,4-alpha-glucosidase [Shewanella maritima]|uniref:glucan 1,4-alpha-glucosidase n=1 Tax=Shewanella maritima TaxID=2520507 RepID=UPI003734EF10
MLQKPLKMSLSTVAKTISVAILGLGLSACSQQSTTANTEAQAQTQLNVAPGAPGIDPTWAFSGKTGIGTSYEPYVNGQYAGLENNPVSKVWFSVAQGILTETMFGMIHNAQLKEMQFIVAGNGFVDTEKVDTTSTIEYLHTDEQGRPLSLAYKITNKAKNGKYQIEKHIFTDPNRDSLMMKVEFTAFEDGITPYLYANPHIDNSGANDIAFVEGNSLFAHTSEQNSSYMSITSDVDFVAASAGFVGTSDGLKDIKANGKLTQQYQTTSADNSTAGNVALTAQLPTLKADKAQVMNITIGFADSKQASLANAEATQQDGYDFVLSAYLGDDKHLGWKDYLASLSPMQAMAANTTDGGKLLNASALVLKAQEDKTHAGALIASLSNPWGDTVSAKVGSTGYKAVWPRDFYQCAMAFLAMGDTETPKVAFEYLKKVQVSQQTPGFVGTPGWFLQKTHVDGQIEWVGVQLDQTAMPIMLGWQLWQAGVLTDAEISQWYQEMLKPAADFLVTGGKVKLDWNDTEITPPNTQQERWEEQAGFSPSTTAAVISGLIAAADMAKLIGEEDKAELYNSTADALTAQLEKTTVTTNGQLNSKIDGKPYYVRISPNGQPNTEQRLLDNNGKPGLDQRTILDGGFLELVRYGVKSADDSIVRNSLALIDDTSLEHNLRVKYEFNAKDGSTVPGYRRYGNDGYGEDVDTGNSYAENGNTEGQRGRVWPFFTGERGHYELAYAKATNSLNEQTKAELINTYVQGMETFANEGLMLPEQAWDGVGNPTRYNYQLGDGTNSATPLAWTHAEYVKLVRSMTDEKVWDFYPIVADRQK